MHKQAKMQTGLALNAEVSATDSNVVTSIAYTRVTEKEVEERGLFFLGLKHLEEEELSREGIHIQDCQSQAQMATAMNQLLLRVESIAGKNWFILILNQLDHTPRSINRLLTRHHYHDLHHWRDGSLHEDAMMYGEHTPSKLSLYRLEPFANGSVVLSYPCVPCIERILPS